VSRSIEKFFNPESVAVIGASAVEGKPGNHILVNILANGYRGRLYLVNPKAGKIMGMDAYPSIQDLPQGIDLAVVILPAKLNPQAVRDCASKGIRAIVLAAGGFSEVDEEGEELQKALFEAVRETGVRVLGPNTSGHTSTPASFTSSFFPLGKIPGGNVSYIAQTGNFATHTMRYIASGEHFGVARVVGLGNKVDIDECDVLEYYAADPETKAVFAYLESLKNPRRFLAIAKEMTRKKPMILLKGGSTSEGAKAAVAHTAALASDDRIIDGVLKQAGIVRIHQYSHLVLAAKAISSMPMPKGNRVSFMAPSGAMLVILTDLCRQKWGLEVPDPEPSTRKRLQEISPPYIRMRNPVDIWPSAIVHGIEYAYGEAMEAVLKDPNIDAVVPVMMITDETGVPDLSFIVDLARKYAEKPVYVTFSAQKKHMDAAKAFLEPRGVPTFPLIEEPFEVLSILNRCRRLMERERNGSESS
jgi:acetyltransferase